MKGIINLQSFISERKFWRWGIRDWRMACVIALPLILLPLVAQAQSIPQFDFGLNEISNVLQLPEGDPREILIRLINVALQFLAIITLVLVVWSGFLFLFSGGKPENMAKAGAVLRNAIIGLVIILSSWAIVRFVITALVNAVNPTEAGAAQTVPTPSPPGR